MSNSLDPDLGPDCLQMPLADNKIHHYQAKN